MGSDDISTLEGESTGGRPEGTPSLAYEDVNLSLTAGYKPTIAVSLVVAVSFVLFGGVIPGMDGGGGGMTTMTYTIVLWGIVVGSLGFVYEYWIERNERGRAE
ncbi:hypothetical protein BRC94_00680 [Halobacteriales archaeon QS_5_70_17]|jgi:hypothetical protein|nr:MAG: hypothetical protein BRC94_00680 [Halobacteriales archaeon QS_5_70_17]